MNESQKQHWEMLLAVDESEAPFQREEIDFVGGLIDAKPSKQGRLTQGEMATIRALHREKVERFTEDKDDEL
jgi:hypothetical protein